MRLPRVRWLLRGFVRLVRRGSPAPVRARRRLVLLQIDGLSAGRLEQALARADMPALRRWIESGQARLRQVVAATPPSTPVFQAGLMYGDRGDVPGFGWYDRELGRAVRMDLPEDVVAVERSLRARAAGRPLLLRGVSYGTIWGGRAARAIFNVMAMQDGDGLPRPELTVRPGGLLVAPALVARVVGGMARELGTAVLDFVRWARHVGSTRFEWRFLYMRLFVSVVMRELATQGAVLDILRGEPVIYIDFLGYDEYAHRRGPDSALALYNLRGIDASIAKLRRATRWVPELGYDVFVFSDHGQSATVPFEKVMGHDLQRFVLERAAEGRVAPLLAAPVIRHLVALREAELWARTLWRPLHAPLRLYLDWLRRRLASGSDVGARAPLEGIQVVTGGSIAHLYFSGRPADRTVDGIVRHYPALIEALLCCPAIGIVVGQGVGGPVVYYRGRRYALADRGALSRLPPFRALGYDLLAGHLRAAAEGHRSGDLVLYGAFAPAGNVAFDFEFGSHGGVAPEELEQFAVHPSHVDWPLVGAVSAEDFYRYFRARYLDPYTPFYRAADHAA